jgi:hypothetical protein
MKRIPLFSSSRITVLVLTSICLALVGASMTVRALKGNANNSPLDERKKTLHIQLQNGLGKEVPLDKVKNSPGHIKQAVESAAKFIENRSGLVISEGVKNRLAALEQSTLARQSRRVSTDELVEILTTTTVDRLSSLSDGEIDQAANSFNGNGEITLRANGKGHLDSTQFKDRAKSMRDLSRQGDENLKGLIRAAMQQEVKNRVDIYSEALPRHFGRAKQMGVTPLQAVLIAYSVASDDFMGQSQTTLNATQELLYAHMKDHGYKGGRRPSKAYGSNGYLFAAPLDLVLNETTMNRLLDHIGERGAR